MQKDIHPEYNNVCFTDISTGRKFITKSTMRSRKKEMIDGEEYYIVICDLTMDSHSVYTGKKTMVDTTGRVERFQNRSRKRGV
ncbi:MAG: 50S ribosomal protein L31 [Verrucomicrobia bacterium CG_4_10_14_3_um_filter_43_23]|nr:MAG: 50S ribosomal protein L31 [Verrucomicrobia bacterium CG1_02_43_26]PIP58862.1 MAG: 50S ribosomal protein L31 [Verrucomicrobia bacterium CG22_combo_CG10-13_8_21_14_all_43_17]PIX57807.1 MAG: 50S ribosomal protein L31 [Verrucomicrobia bacterium CG_4_10_14_3_um_filter_43_23]PIY62068.1 MAG: 50S ribosomal protein L31 [Verrucomicrobia bacterium CG_4_10_14_0_8_um_filter_43_34]PJA44915.1 MAG: 50S ribosomal protein L31 [Verrucomicrobia bacterium CG_4_9_14_3_um_filter_43_20]